MVSLPVSRPQVAPVSTLFIGIDVGKNTHVAAFISAGILKQKRFEQCPTLSFKADRAGFITFLAAVKQYAPGPGHAAVVLEATGHYHRTLASFLAEEGFEVFVVAVRTKRQVGVNKSDAHDARRLANGLYAQLALGLQVEDRSHEARKLLPPIPVAQQLYGYVFRRYELAQDFTRSSNKLGAICDELFPEFTQAFASVWRPIALDLRDRFPLPTHLVHATLEQLRVVRRGSNPPDAKLLQLQSLARTSIGITNAARVASLTLEQRQLIEELRMISRHMTILEEKIQELVEGSREGQILLSVPGCGHLLAATIIAMVGNISNFHHKSDLRKFCGWAPRAFQTGSSHDRVDQFPTGSRLLKRAIYMLVLVAITRPDANAFGKLYMRLVPKKCIFDARTNTYKGKKRVVGRVAGQAVGVIWRLLRDDADLVKNWTRDEPLPAPVLYDPEVHAGTGPGTP